MRPPSALHQGVQLKQKVCAPPCVQMQVSPTLEKQEHMPGARRSLHMTACLMMPPAAVLCILPISQ